MTDLAWVQGIWYQPPSEGVQECISVQVIGGPKRFMRIWPDAILAGQDYLGGVEWGWVVGQTAQQVWDDTVLRSRLWNLVDDWRKIDGAAPMADALSELLRERKS